MIDPDEQANRFGQVPTLCAGYLQQLRAQGYKASTLQAYQRDLEQFAGYLGHRNITHISQLTEDTLSEFLDALQYGEALKPNSIKRKWESTRLFLRYAESRQLLKSPFSTSITIKCPPRTPRRHSPESVQNMISSISIDTPLGLRNRTMLQLLWDTGLSPEEIVKLNLHKPGIRRKYCIDEIGIIQYTDSYQRSCNTCCLAKSLELLSSWLCARPFFIAGDSNNALFLSSQGKRLTKKIIHTVIREASIKAGLTGVAAKSFQRSYSIENARQRILRLTTLT